MPITRNPIRFTVRHSCQTRSRGTPGLRRGTRLCRVGHPCRDRTLVAGDSETGLRGISCASVSHAAQASPMSDLRVEEIDPSAGGRWDRYVEQHKDGLVYHHSGWLRALQAEYGQRPVGLTLVDSRGELHGLLPLMATRGLPVLRSSGITGRRLSSLPRTPVAGPIADDRTGLRCCSRRQLSEPWRCAASAQAARAEAGWARPPDRRPPLARDIHR